MPFGVRLRFVLLSSPQGRAWRAPAFGFLFTSLLLWLTGHLPTWAQPPAPSLLISEVHPAPHAVGDEAGEWLEITNLSAEAVNLQFWTLLNQGDTFYQFPFELWIPAGGYILLARDGDPAKNGGIQPAYVYDILNLANQREHLTLRDPTGQIVDSVAWGEGTDLVVQDGASLERSAADANAPWVVSHSPWPGSAGDLGSPGMPYSPPPTATPTPSLTPSPTVIPSPTSTPTLSPTPTLTPPPAVPPRLFLSEIMANPDAVSDEMGEWVELYNGDTFPINLNGWILADQDDDQVVLNGDLWLPPGGYIILARVADPVQNGGVATQLLYAGLQLANEVDELLLITPWGVPVDQFFWGEGTLQITTGASLERTAFDATATWATAHIPWPASAGDLGSPGAPYLAPTPTPTPTPSPSPTPTSSATALPSATPTRTPPPATAPRLLLSEMMANPSAVSDEMGEWIELYNADTIPINLDGWILADQDDDQIVLSGELWLPPGSYLVLARLGDPAQNGGVAVQITYSGLQLANEADELH